MRRGFTLVELLIALTIIGVLASGLLLSGGSATSSARALTIITDLRVMKEATLMLYLDSMDHFEKADEKALEDLTPSTVLARYLDNPNKYGEAYFEVANDGRWYIAYPIRGASAREVKASLAGRASSAGLLAGASPGRNYNGDSDTVYMLVR